MTETASTCTDVAAWRTLKQETYGDTDSVSDAQFLIDAFTADGNKPADLPGVASVVFNVNGDFPVELTTEAGDEIVFYPEHGRVAWCVWSSTRPVYELPYGQHNDPASATSEALDAAAALH